MTPIQGSSTTQGGFFDLGFYAPDDTGEAEPNSTGRGSSATGGPPPLMLGKTKSPLRWEIAAWLEVAAGIFARQGLDLSALSWKTSNVNVGAAIASIVVALAVFPMAMRWLNRRRRRAGLEHVAGPFAFGFFLNLAVVGAAKIPASFFSRL